ncbi:MAG: thymidylate synthase [Bdellovibrionaceae bacterium]|nr:thymidylate synthase [Pseudobdellovibrionaceae bacterium]
MHRLSQETQYLNIIKNIIKNGVKEKGRNGTTYSVIGGMMRFSLKNGSMPLVTTKKLAWKTCLKELLWFINGDTDNKLLQQQNVKIWNDNASRSFLNSQGLHQLRENDLGPVYGHQWRHWNAKYTDCKTDYSGKGIDQLQNIIDVLQKKNIDNNSNSRRLIMSAWNPEQINQMALPPCHVLSQFHVTNNKLSCTLYQRSADMGLGVPFNIASYSFLTHLLAKHCNLEANEFIHFLGNAHIYDDHIDSLNRQLENEIFWPPKLYIKNKYENIEDYKLNDFIIKNYKSHDTIKMKMRP